MARKLVPMLRFPFSFFEEGEEEGWLQDVSQTSGMSVSEDNNFIYIEAAVPGVKPEDIEMTFDQGILWIKGERKEESEDKNKKFYRKSTNAFSYRLAVPGNVDETKQPEATCKNGMLRVAFPKTKAKQSKKIPVKSS